MWNKKGLAEWLSNKRTLDGLSQDDLALRVKCGKAQISKIETQRVNPSLEFLVKLSSSLGVSLSEPLEAMGYLKPHSSNTAAEAHTLRFVHYYKTLKPEDQKLVEEIVKVIWRERGAKDELEEKPQKRKPA